MPKVVGSRRRDAFLAGRVIAVGGEGTTTASRRGAGLRRAPSRLVAAATSAEPRHGPAVVALRGSLYSIGGAAAAGHVQPTQDVYILDLE